MTHVGEEKIVMEKKNFVSVHELLSKIYIFMGSFIAI